MKRKYVGIVAPVKYQVGTIGTLERLMHGYKKTGRRRASLAVWSRLLAMNS